MVRVLTSGFTKEYTLDMCSFFAKHETWSRKSGNWLE